MDRHRATQRRDRLLRAPARSLKTTCYDEYRGALNGIDHTVQLRATLAGEGPGRGVKLSRVGAALQVYHIVE